jgi:hypothetical protein
VFKLQADEFPSDDKDLEPLSNGKRKIDEKYDDLTQIESNEHDQKNPRVKNRNATCLHNRT